MERPDLDRALLISSAAAPHDGSDPSRELARLEGFDDVVVRAELESEHPIDLLAPGREHHDGDVRLLADLPSEISAVPVGKHHIEQHEVGRLASEGLSSACKRGCHLGIEPLTPEALRQWFRDGRLVLDQQDLGPHRPMVLADLSFLTEESWRPKNGIGPEGGHMSVMAVVGENGVRRPRSRPEPKRLLALEACVSLVVVAGLVWQVADNWGDFEASLSQLLPWLAVVVVADLLPVPIWGSVELMMSFPVLLASALVFPPYVAGSLSFVGTLDLREFRGEISPLRDLYNRSNVTASVFAASWIFHWFGVGVLDWPEVLILTFVALVADMVVNFSLVILGAHLLTGLSAKRLWTNVYGGSRPEVFLGGYACFGLLAVLMATVYSAAGNAGLVAFAIPLLISRQMFTHWKRLGEANRSIAEKERALTAVSSRIADERRDERLALAAGIHDEVLPPLYKVHLMGQVVKHDLASGRLLDLESDVPELIHAVDSADSSLREMVRGLRRSTIGTAGLGETIGLLVSEVEATTHARVETFLRPVGGSPLIQLLVYQLAREALSNAARHANATTIVLVLDEDDDSIRLRITDDGQGFSMLGVDSTSHFGLQLMRERVELAGGILLVDSHPGEGTTVLARLPIDEKGPGP
jgi:signal transduction histidine kinase